MCEINSKVADDSIYIEDPKIQIEQGSATALDLFSYLCRIAGDDISTVQGNLWSNSILSNNIKGWFKIVCWEGN